MTPAELRRLAEKNTVTGVALNNDAARLRAQAAELDGILDPLIPMSQRVWAGPAAEDFESQVLVHSAALADQVQRLNAIAAELEGRADTALRAASKLRAEAAALESAPLGVP